MALIIKNANIDQEQTKKVGYTPLAGSEQPYLDELDTADLPAEEFMNESSIETEQNPDALETSPSDHASFNSTEPDTKPLFQLTDDGIEYENVQYVHHENIQNLVEVSLAAKVEELEKTIEEQKETGFQQGYEQGENKAITDYQNKINDLSELVSNIENAFELKIKDQEDLIKEAIFVGITKVLGELVNNTDQRISMIENVIKSLSTSTPYTLRVSEQDYKILSENNEKTEKFNIDTLICDDRVGLGGCIVETEKGIFDGRLEVQLARLKDTIDSKVD